MENISACNYQESMMSSAHTVKQHTLASFTHHPIWRFFFALHWKRWLSTWLRIAGGRYYSKYVDLKNTFSPSPLTESVKIGYSHFMIATLYVPKRTEAYIDNISEYNYTQNAGNRQSLIYKICMLVCIPNFYLYKLQTRKIFVYWTFIACKAWKHPHPSQ